MYALILTIDANFRLKLKEKGWAEDPPLGDGWSHFVLQGAFKDYVQKWGWQVEVCNASLPNAMSFTNVMYSQIYVIRISPLLITVRRERPLSLLRLE